MGLPVHAILTGDCIAELKKLTKAGFDEFETWPQKFGSA